MWIYRYTISDYALARISHQMLALGLWCFSGGRAEVWPERMGYERRAEVRRSGVRGGFGGCPGRWRRNPTAPWLRLVHNDRSAGRGAGQQRRIIGRAPTRFPYTCWKMRRYGQLSAIDTHTLRIVTRT